MTFGERLRAARKQKKLTQKELAKLINAAHNSISNWENDQNKPDPDTIQNLCWALDVQPNYFFGETSKSNPLPAPRIAEDVVTFPIITSVAAHYDSLSFNEGGVEGDNVEIPQKYLRGRPASDYCVMRVKGDSMYPEFRDGDLVLVLLQATLNRPRDIGVIAYGDEEMTIKRIDFVHGEDWLEMIPINPHYPPKRIEDAELERCRVIGIPKLLIREL